MTPFRRWLWTICGPTEAGFWAVGACKCDTRKALDFPTLRFGTRRSLAGVTVSLARESTAGEPCVASVRILNAFREHTDGGSESKAQAVGCISPERRHLRRKIVELATEFSCASGRGADSSRCLGIPTTRNRALPRFADSNFWVRWNHHLIILVQLVVGVAIGARVLYFLPTTWTREQLGSNNDF